MMYTVVIQSSEGGSLVIMCSTSCASPPLSVLPLGPLPSQTERTREGRSDCAYLCSERILRRAERDALLVTHALGQSMKI